MSETLNIPLLTELEIDSPFLVYKHIAPDGAKLFLLPYVELTLY